ncbi:MAG TPA: LLM class flavin-dependent oxidoreductase [Stellaceae bacterium]|nr:LLM class flavin-dependent oxidoreductase [Stellaceae bacterium]
MERVGIAFSGGPGPREIVECVKLAEGLGYESAWVAEGHGGDQFAILAACAAATSKIRLGTAISSVFVRSAPTIAMAAASLDDLSGGRFSLGLGSSHKVQVENEHGLRYEKPLTRLRETVEIVRALCRDGRVGHSGETVRIADFELWFAPPRRRIPIYLSAVFPKMTALAGEIADGLILTRSTLATAALARRHLAEGAARAGRGPGEIAVTSLFPAAVAESRREALAALRPGLAFYAGFFPRYNRLMAEHGFAEEAAAVAAAWSRGDRAAAERATSDKMIAATSVAGTPEEARRRLAALRHSGIEMPIVSPYARGPGAGGKFEAVIRACAPAAGERG